MVSEFTQRVISIIRSIPKGKVLTYGRIAGLAGNPRGARQISRILHSSSRKYNLPWHRVIGSEGRISLKDPMGYEKQKALLKSEGVVFNKGDKIDLEKYLWHID